MATTRSPRATSRRTTGRPMNPLPPVTTTRMPAAQPQSAMTYIAPAGASAWRIMTRFPARPSGLFWTR